MKRFFALLATVIAVATGVAFAQDKSDADFQKLIESKNLQIVIDQIFPQSGPMIPSTDGYRMIIEGDIVNAGLPFFGESYTGMIGGVDEPGIRFDDAKVSIKVKKAKKKGEYSWSFSATSGNENVEVVITLWTNGSAEIFCNPANRSSIRYRGSFSEVEE